MSGLLGCSAVRVTRIARVVMVVSIIKVIRVITIIRVIINLFFTVTTLMIKLVGSVTVIRHIYMYG